MRWVVVWYFLHGIEKTYSMRDRRTGIYTMCMFLLYTHILVYSHVQYDRGIDASVAMCRANRKSITCIKYWKTLVDSRVTMSKFGGYREGIVS